MTLKTRHWLSLTGASPLVTLIAGSLKPIDELIPPCLHVSLLLTNPYTSLDHKTTARKLSRRIHIKFLLFVNKTEINKKHLSHNKSLFLKGVH